MEEGKAWIETDGIPERKQWLPGLVGAVSTSIFEHRLLLGTGIRRNERKTNALLSVLDEVRKRVGREYTGVRP